MTTKYRIAEQIQRLFKGNPVISGRVHIKEIMLLVEQVANRLLKAEHFQVNMPEGDTVPPNCMVFTYDAVPVATYKTTLSKATLPAIPINLPKNVGVLHVSKVDDINNPFVPIPTSTYGIVKPQALLGDLSGLIGYEVIGKDLVFTKNLPALGVSTVYIRLVGVDLSQVSETELLPISADMEAEIVDTVFKLVLQAPSADKKNSVD